VVVHGEVQGVGFRFNARSTARHLGVSGYTRNLPDGTVEVDAEGSEAAVQRMLDWLADGPRHARVTSLDVTELEPTGQAGFDIRR
jgi:acylphosphatase